MMIRYGYSVFPILESNSPSRHKRRQQSVAARLLLQRLYQWRNVSFDRPYFRRQRLPFSKFLDHKKVYFSLAHSRQMAACAAGDGKIGIDIEYIDPSRAVLALARAAFGTREQEVVELQGIEAFYRIWCLREAYAKATGDGFSIVVDGIDRFEDPLPRYGRIKRIGRYSWFCQVVLIDRYFMLALIAQWSNSRRPKLLCEKRLQHSHLVELQ